MARPNDLNRQRHGRGPDPVQQQEQEQEKEQEQEVVQETEQEQEKNTTQEKLGNQAIAAMLGMPGVTPGNAGVVMDMLSPEQQEGVQYGGDDDEPIEDGPLTLEDLTRSWNPGTRKSEEHTPFKEPMPEDDLPPEDEAWLEAVATDPIVLPHAHSIDALIQPSRAALAGAMTPWAREAARWGDGSLPHRALTSMIAPPAPFLQDPYGRVGVSRARAAALCTWLVLDGPALQGEPGPATSAFLDFCLELGGSGRSVHSVWCAAEAAGVDLPIALDVYTAAELRDPSLTVRMRALPEPCPDRLVTLLTDLVDLTSARALLPALQAPTADDDESELDPLGLDAILDQFTGGRPDPQAALFAAAIASAEKLAAACARARVRMAGVAMAVADVGALWTSGAPAATLREVLKGFDEKVLGALQLLVQVARAAQRQEVAPRGLSNGLKRAARMLDKSVAACVRELAKVCGGIVPGLPSVPPPPLLPMDRLAGAWADGQPSDALPWLEALPPSLDRTAAIAFTRAAAGHPPDQLAEAFSELGHSARAADRPVLASVAATCLGPCLLWQGRIDEALVLAEEHMALGLSRRNGSVLGEAALLSMEAHRIRADLPSAEAVRMTAGRQLYSMGALGPLTVLARWKAPSEREIQ